MSDNFQFAKYVLSPCAFSSTCHCKSYTVWCCPWLRLWCTDLLWTRQAPDWDGTGTGILWTMAPAQQLPAGHHRVVLLETPVLSTTCQDRASSCPACWREIRSRNPTPARTFKKVSFNIFSGGTLKIFTVWRLNFSPENCPGQAARCVPGHLLGLTRNCKVGALLSWLKEIGGGNFRNILKC